MVLDRLAGAELYLPLHPGLAAGFEFLRRDDVVKLEPGRHPLDGERLFALVASQQGRGQAAARLEAHRKYIDIQCVLAGTDRIGWRSTSQCVQVTEPFDVARDIEFFAEPPSTWHDVAAGEFVLFFPGDAHAPLAGDGPVHKVIVKVAIEWDRRRP